MDRIDINLLNPDEIRRHLAVLEGITPEVADALAVRVSERLVTRDVAFADADELTDTLKELGIGPASIERVTAILTVGPGIAITVDEPYDFDFQLDPKFFLKRGDDPGFAPEQLEEMPEASRPPNWFGTNFPRTNRPLVVVPGIMGSRLHSISNGHPELIESRKIK